MEDLEQIESAVHEKAADVLGKIREEVPHLEADVRSMLHDFALGLMGMDRKIDAMGGDVARLLAVVEQVAAQAEQVGRLFGGGEGEAGAAPDLGAALGGGLGGNLLGGLLKRKLG